MVHCAKALFLKLEELAAINECKALKEKL